MSSLPDDTRSVSTGYLHLDHVMWGMVSLRSELGEESVVVSMDVERRSETQLGSRRSSEGSGVLPPGMFQV